METPRDLKIQERMQMAFELYEVGEQMMRHKIRQRHSSWSEEEVERKVIDWLQDRPDVRLGDAAGQRNKRFRTES